MVDVDLGVDGVGVRGVEDHVKVLGLVEGVVIGKEEGKREREMEKE